MQANYAIATDALNRARKTWQASHNRSQARATAGEIAGEARAREHFYQCKQQCQNVMQAALGDFGQHYSQDSIDRDMVSELHATQGAEWRTYSIPGSTTVGATLTKLDPPSDEEVMRALHRKLFSEGRSPAKGDIKIVKELRATYVDDPRVHPEVGQAQRHHAIYKCTVGYVELEDDQTIEVFYIDHNHLHRFDKTPHQAQTGEPEAASRDSEVAPAGGEFISTKKPGKAWISSAADLIDNDVFESKAKALALNAKGDSALAETNAKRRDAAARQLEAMESAYEAGTVTIDQLLEAQRRHSEAQMVYYQTILQTDSDSADHRRLLHEANVVVAKDATISARRTWQKAYAKYRQGVQGGEASVEAQAREQFYQFKQQFEQAKRGYLEELERQGKAPSERTSQRARQPKTEADKRIQAEMNRVSILGPIASGETPTTLDPPGDEEVLRVWRQKLVPAGWPIPSKITRIAKELVATYTDPPRMFPLIGKAEMHHAHYKCTVTCEDEQGKNSESVLFVDHHHLHLMSTLHHTPPANTSSRPVFEIRKQLVQLRHFQIQLARERVKLADLEQQYADNQRKQLDMAQDDESALAARRAEIERQKWRIKQRELELQAAKNLYEKQASNAESSPVIPVDKHD